jgi:hypothetical protein
VRHIQAADACKACWYCPCQGVATEAHLCELGKLAPAGGYVACKRSSTCLSTDRCHCRPCMAASPFKSRFSESTGTITASDWS